jgi:putative oxidoreductase
VLTTAEIGLLVLRVAFGFVMVAHGGEKAFGWFGGRGFAGAVDNLRELRIRPPMFWTIVVIASELGAGLGLMLGLLTPVAAASLMANMVVILGVHWKRGFWGFKGGFEYPFLMLCTASALGIAGGGPMSLDAVLGLSSYLGMPTFVVSAGATVTTALVILATRRALP